MIYAEDSSSTGALDPRAIYAALSKGLSGRFTNQRVLVLIPDHTRSLPLPELFCMSVEILRDTRQLDFMVALGTHPALPQESINRMVGISAEERGRAQRRLCACWPVQPCLGRPGHAHLAGDIGAG